MSIEQKAMTLLRAIEASGAQSGQDIRADTHKWAKWSGATSNLELYKEIVPWLKQHGYFRRAAVDGDGCYKLNLG